MEKDPSLQGHQKNVGQAQRTPVDKEFSRGVITRSGHVVWKPARYTDPGD